VATRGGVGPAGPVLSGANSDCTQSAIPENDRGAPANTTVLPVATNATVNTTTSTRRRVSLAFLTPQASPTHHSDQRVAHQRHNDFAHRPSTDAQRPARKPSTLSPVSTMDGRLDGLPDQEHWSRAFRNSCEHINLIFLRLPRFAI